MEIAVVFHWSIYWDSFHMLVVV